MGPDLLFELKGVWHFSTTLLTLFLLLELSVISIYEIKHFTMILFDIHDVIIVSNRRAYLVRERILYSKARLLTVSCRRAYLIRERI